MRIHLHCLNFAKEVATVNKLETFKQLTTIISRKNRGNIYAKSGKLAENWGKRENYFMYPRKRL